MQNPGKGRNRHLYYRKTIVSLGLELKTGLLEFQLLMDSNWLPSRYLFTFSVLFNGDDAIVPHCTLPISKDCKLCDCNLIVWKKINKQSTYFVLWPRPMQNLIRERGWTGC